MFHAKDGWFFTRLENGTVAIEKRKDAKETSPIVSYATFTPDEWASIVASVSKTGEANRRFFQALSFHSGADFTDLVNAVQEIFREPYGCPFCDSGILRNPKKSHSDDCGFELARLALEKATGVSSK